MSHNLYEMQDPRKQYPGPPADSEIQPAPGTQKAMTEKPDCGETSYKGAGRLAGRRALLTGADSGIGRAAAIAFAREGADVAISYLPEEQADAEEVADLIRDAGQKAVLLPGDVSQEAFCLSVVADAVGQLGGLDILVNNAGRMGKTNGLLDTTSVQGYDPSPKIFDYAVTKAAIANFTQGLSQPLMEENGIRINAVAPGPIWTPLQEADGDKKKLESLGGKTPFKRPGQPVELAPVYVLLASQEGSYITGEIYGVTGGMTSIG